MMRAEPVTGVQPGYNPLLEVGYDNNPVSGTKNQNGAN